MEYYIGTRWYIKVVNHVFKMQDEALIYSLDVP